MRIRVVLPAPLAPSSPTTSPGPTVRSTPSTAVNRPKTRRTPAHSARAQARAPSSSARRAATHTASCRSGVTGLAPGAPAAASTRQVPRAPPGPAPLVRVRGRAGRDRDRARHRCHDLGRGARGEGPPRVQDEHLRRPRRLVQVGGGHQHGRAARGGAGDEPPQVGPAHRVHARGRLVEDQQVRPGQQRRDHAQLAPHPAGQLPGEPVPGRGEPGPFQVLADPRGRPPRPPSRRRPNGTGDSPPP